MAENIWPACCGPLTLQSRQSRLSRVIYLWQYPTSAAFGCSLRLDKTKVIPPRALWLWNWLRKFPLLFPPNGYRSQFLASLLCLVRLKSEVYVKHLAQYLANTRWVYSFFRLSWSPNTQGMWDHPAFLFWQLLTWLYNLKSLFLLKICITCHCPPLPILTFISDLISEVTFF